MQSDAINKFAIQMNIQWAFVDLLLQVAGEIGKERHAVLSFLQKSCSTLQLRILVHVITWCFCMLSVLSICSIWLLFKKEIPWLPQDDYDKLALQYLSYARCLILDTFLWLSEWWTVINFLHFAKILVPIVLVYSIYSLKFECHKGIVASLGCNLKFPSTDHPSRATRFWKKFDQTHPKYDCRLQGTCCTCLLPWCMPLALR